MARQLLQQHPQPDQSQANLKVHIDLFNNIKGVDLAHLVVHIDLFDCIKEVDF